MKNRIRQIENKVFIDDEVVAKIKKIEIIKEDEGLFTITFRLLSGEHKGNDVVDKVSSMATNRSYGWKYPLLKSILGISNSEKDYVDLDDMFLNKLILLKLSAFDCESRNGVPYQLQKINYKRDFEHKLDNFVVDLETEYKEVRDLDDFSDIFVDDMPPMKTERQETTAI